MQLKKLNLGCGIKRLAGYLNLDSSPEVNPEVVHNLNKFPWPFKDSTFEEVFASHTFEHLDDLNKVMSEIWRISKPNAKLKIIVPYFAYVGAFKDPTHKRFFTWQTLEYFDLSNTEFAHYSVPKFKILSRKLSFGLIHRLLGLQFLANRFPYIYEHYLVYLFPAREFSASLAVVK